MNLRDWLIVIGVIIIVGILLDGYRRMRLARKDSLQMSRDMGGEFENTPLDEMPNPELPGGGARVVAKGIDSVDDDLSERTEPSLGDSNVAGIQGEPGMANPENDMFENNMYENDMYENDMYENDKPEDVLVADIDSRVDTSVDSVPTAHVVKREKKKSSVKSLDDKISSSKGSSEGSKADQEVIVINVHSRQDLSFSGRDIKELLYACGLDHGDMSIFHRHEEDDLLSPIQFSVANSVEPGYFDPETLDETNTPGVSFFMSLPGPKDYMKAFDYMLETAQCFAKNLGGELKDENRSVMTSQTIEHCRHRIREFERKQLSKSKA